MKQTLGFLLVSSLFLLISCNTSKPTAVANSEIFGPTWEMEYISGPKIAFEALYPDRKPIITFDKSTSKVTGNDSCNGYIADFEINGDEISFGQPGPSTLMYCGEGETHFLNTIKKIDSYNIASDGKLNLMIDNVPMMRFSKLKL